MPGSRFKWFKTPANVKGKVDNNARSNIPSLLSLPPPGMLPGTPRGPGYPRYQMPGRSRGAPPGFSDLTFAMGCGPPFMGHSGPPVRGFGSPRGGRPPYMGRSSPMGRGGSPMGMPDYSVGHGFPMGRGGGFPTGGGGPLMEPLWNDVDDYSEHPSQTSYKSSPVQRELLSVHNVDKSQKMKRKGKKRKKQKKDSVQSNTVDVKIPVLDHKRKEEESGGGDEEPAPKRKKIESVKNRYLIDQIVMNLQKPKNYKVFRDTLMYSQWFLDVPPDFGKNWIVVPCPPGKRMLVVAGKGITRSFAKCGDVIYSFYSALPGGHPVKNDECSKSLTILDCFWHHKSKTYYILDALHWNNLPLLESQAIFRFSWLEQKLSENPELSEVSEENEFCFQYIPRHSCAEEVIAEVMSSDPLVFNDLTVIVDGFMFYKSNSFYISGDCPGVGWLKPFMVPDVLKVNVCSELLVDRPNNYVGVKEFVEEFKKEKKKVILRERKMRRLKFGEYVAVEEKKEGGGEEEEGGQGKEKAEEEKSEMMKTNENETSDAV